MCCLARGLRTPFFSELAIWPSGTTIPSVQKYSDSRFSYFFARACIFFLLTFLFCDVLFCFFLLVLFSLLFFFFFLNVLTFDFHPSTLLEVQRFDFNTPFATLPACHTYLYVSKCVFTLHAPLSERRVLKRRANNWQPMQFATLILYSCQLLFDPLTSTVSCYSVTLRCPNRQICYPGYSWLKWHRHMTHFAQFSLDSSAGFFGANHLALTGGGFFATDRAAESGKPFGWVGHSGFPGVGMLNCRNQFYTSNPLRARSKGI